MVKYYEKSQYGIIIDFYLKILLVSSNENDNKFVNL